MLGKINENLGISKILKLWNFFFNNQYLKWNLIVFSLGDEVWSYGWGNMDFLFKINNLI